MTMVHTFTVLRGVYIQAEAASVRSQNFCTFQNYVSYTILYIICMQKVSTIVVHKCRSLHADNLGVLFVQGVYTHRICYGYGNNSSAWYVLYKPIFSRTDIFAV